VHVELGSLALAADRLTDDVPTVVMCGHGERASTAASLLAARGLTQVSILAGGPEDWADSTGQRLETGS
jgi:hydroxyacylglutathione hydrolase